MRIIDCEQGSLQWFRARLGIPTASEFDKIVTPVKCELSKQADRYAYRLIAERLLNQPMETMEGTVWMERGKEKEPTAAMYYGGLHDVETVPVGFITTDDGTLGCSPDRLVKDRPVGVEIKCPSPPVHLAYMLSERAPEYRPQVQGQLYVAELERVDLFSFHPAMPFCTIKTPRDEAYIKQLASALGQFNERLLSLLERAKTLGIFQAYEQALTPTEVERAQDLDSVFRHELGLIEGAR